MLSIPRGEVTVNRLKVMVIVLEVLLVVSVGFIAMVTMYNGGLERDLLASQSELLTTKATLNTTEDTLQETMEEKEEATEQWDTLQHFTTAFFTAEGTFRLARSIKETADAKYLLGGDAYNADEWNDSIAYFNESMNNYSVAGQKYYDAEALFNVAKAYTENTVYQDFCSTYAQLCVSASNRTNYLSGAAGYMQSACEFYRDGDNVNGGNEVSKANVRINEHASEVEIYDALYAEINDILMQLG